jgi:hypothetical protein
VNTKRLKMVIPRIVVFGVMVAIGIMTVAPLPVYAATRTLYWVGGTGNTNDVNHWDEHEGGAGGDAVPDIDDNIIFGASSFAIGGQTVTVNAILDCQDMNWTNATNTPNFAGASQINASRNVTFITGMQQSYTGQLTFATASAASQLVAPSTLLCTVAVYDAASTLTLMSNLTQSGKDFSFGAGTLITNGYNITTRGIYLEGAGVKTLTMSTSTINCSGGWNASGTNITINVNAGTIKVTGTGDFDGAGKVTYNNIELNGTAHTISDSNTFAKLSFKPTAGQTITFTDTTTQTAASFERTGTGQIVFQGSAAAGWNDLTISRSTANPAATFYATTDSVNGGNNTAWTFPQTVSTQEATAGVSTYTMNGTLTDLGGDPATTTVYFQYGNTIGLGNNTPAVAMTDHGTFNVTMPNPSDSARVYFRGVTSTAGSTTFGAITSIAFTSAVGEVLIKGILRTILAGVILVGCVIGMKGGNPAVTVAIGLLAFAVIDAFINMM